MKNTIAQLIAVGHTKLLIGFEVHAMRL